MHELADQYERALRTCEEPTAAAIMVLAYQFRSLEYQVNEIATQLGFLEDRICKGIRYGLFGANAADDTSIKGST